MLGQLKKIYADSSLHTVIADGNHTILWSNRDESFVGQSSSVFFGMNTPLPEKSGTYHTTRYNTPCRYDVIRHDDNGCVYYIICETSSNTFLDTISNPAVAEYLSASAANSIDHLQNLCATTDTICDVLKKSGNTIEVSYTNEQMKSSYGLLAELTVFREMLMYTDDIPASVVNVSDCMGEIREELSEMSQYSDCSINVDSEEKLFVSANKERFMFSLASAMATEITHNGSVSEIRLRAYSENDNVTVALNCGAPSGSYTTHSHHIYSDSSSSDTLELLGLRMFCDRFGGRLSHMLSENGGHSIIITLPKADGADAMNSAPKEIVSSKRFSPFKMFLAGALNYNYYG